MAIEVKGHLIFAAMRKLSGKRLDQGQHIFKAAQNVCATFACTQDTNFANDLKFAGQILIYSCRATWSAMAGGQT